MITSSRLELAERCPGHLTRQHRDEPNEWSDAGTERHAADEQAINAGEVPEEYMERWPGLAWRSEVRYVYDVSDGTSEFCGVGSTRNYGTPGPFKVGGTIDVEGRGDGLLIVVDRKGFEEQTPAERHPQVRFLALAAARHAPAERIIVAIRPEVGPMDVAEIDPMFDLDAIAYDTRQLLIRSAAVRADARAGKPVQFNTGRWCRWCPAFADCPKQDDLKALVKLDDEDPELALQLVMDDDSAPDVYALYKRIGILHKRIGQSVHAYASQRPIPLGGGRFYGKQSKQGNEKLDGETVWCAVFELHDRDTADRAVVRSATKKRLDKALKGKRGAAKRVLELVRERGGATRTAGTEMTEYTAGPRLVADDDEPQQLTEGEHTSPF